MLFTRNLAITTHILKVKGYNKIFQANVESRVNYTYIRQNRVETQMSEETKQVIK